MGYRSMEEMALPLHHNFFFWWIFGLKFEGDDILVLVMRFMGFCEWVCVEGLNFEFVFFNFLMKKHDEVARKKHEDEGREGTWWVCVFDKKNNLFNHY
jgi:hypothetical protein